MFLSDAPSQYFKMSCTVNITQWLIASPHTMSRSAVFSLLMSAVFFCVEGQCSETPQLQSENTAPRGCSFLNDFREYAMYDGSMQATSGACAVYCTQSIQASWIDWTILCPSDPIKQCSGQMVSLNFSVFGSNWVYLKTMLVQCWVSW